MKNREKQIRLLRVLILLNLLFIWGNSLLPGEISGALSDWVKKLLEAIMGSSGMETPGGGLLRKLAHFAEFTSLGFLLSMLLRLRQKRIRYALPMGMLAACVDETIQMFVPDRGPGLLDVGIDSCGVLTGMILLYTGHLLSNRKKQFGG